MRSLAVVAVGVARRQALGCATTAAGRCATLLHTSRRTYLDHARGFEEFEPKTQEFMKPYDKAESRRTGVLARKLGMIQTYNDWGWRLPLTALQLEDVTVVGHRTEEKDGYRALILGSTPIKEKKVKKPVLGQFKKNEVDPKRTIREYKVSEDAMLPIGSKLQCSHFIPGQYVDVQGTTIGKGFQGGMKRHNFSGMPASHGVTKTHRRVGGLGGGQDPGRVWPGKRMPGRMGGKKRYQHNLQVYQIDTRNDLVFVVGSIPGAKNSIVSIRDSFYKQPAATLPFPTLPADVYPEAIIVAPKSEEDPFKFTD